MIYKNPQIAFIDEFGDTNLDTEKHGVSTHFIVSAVIVESSQIDIAREMTEKIRTKYFSKGELKSNKLGKRKDKRRLKILSDIAEIPALYYSVVIDKRRIDPNSGLIYKKPYLKFLNGLLHRRLYQAYPNLLVIADEHGSEAFMEGFKKYVHKRHIPDFFLQADFKHSPSHKEVMVQIADMIAGTLARIYDGKKISANAKKFLSIMEPKTLGIEEWPPHFGFSFSEPKSGESSEHDESIREIALNKAIQYVIDNQDSDDEDTQYQVETLKYLLYAAQYLDQSHYVQTARLIEILEQFNGVQIQSHSVRSSIISKLRDKGLLIASSKQGYKLPNCYEDLLETVKHFNGMIGPMISRLQEARSQIKLATMGEVDILADEEYRYLRILAEDVGI